ncbi:MAG: hypothetical protein IJP17_07460 [Clostridia bacterium]|nr:hypothetical protein [Clostridia bacterium]
MKDTARKTGNTTAVSETAEKQPAALSRLPIKWIAIAAAAVILIAAGLWGYLSYAVISLDSGLRFVPTSVTELDLSEQEVIRMTSLRRCRKLRLLDLRGCVFPEEQLSAVSEALPECVIKRTVTLGGKPYDSGETSITLPEGVTAQELSLLRYFPDLSHVDASACTEYDALLALSGEMPGCTFDWVVDVCGIAVSDDDTALDLGGADIGDIDDLSLALSYLPALEYVNLRGCDIAQEDIDRLMSEYPEHEFVYDIKLYGRVFGCKDEEIDLSDIKIEDTAELESAISRLRGVRKIVMCDCGLTNDEMEALCGKYPDIRFVWRVRLGIWSLRTDATYFCTNISSQNTPRLKNSDIKPLKYCTDLEHLDLGHNPITDLSPLAGLTKLRTLIVIGSTVKDLSPLANMTEMEYLELFINDIRDLTPLSNMHKLLDLNLCYNDIEDVTPLLGLTQLERLWISCNFLDEEDEAALREALPNCEFNFTALASTGGGWRRHERYFQMRENFGYQPDREKYGF